MSRHFNLPGTSFLGLLTKPWQANAEQVIVTDTGCSSICVTYGIKTPATQNPRAILSLRSGDGDDKIPTGFRWTPENLFVLVSPVPNNLAEPAVIFLRDKNSITIQVVDGCDLILKNEACQSVLNINVTSGTSNIESSGGKSLHNLTIKSVLGNVTVGGEIPFVSAGLVDIYTKAGNISVFLRCCHITLESMSGNIRGDIILDSSTSQLHPTAKINSETMSDSVDMKVLPVQPLQYVNDYRSMSGDITLKYGLSHAARWELEATAGDIWVNGMKKRSSTYQEDGLGLIRAKTATGDIVSEAVCTRGATPNMEYN